MAVLYLAVSVDYYLDMGHCGVLRKPTRRSRQGEPPTRFGGRSRKIPEQVERS